MAAVDKVTTFKIFVGNLPEDTASEEIRQLFEEFGTVVECDSVGNKAFVHMEDDVEGKQAVSQLQARETDLNGNKLTIEEANRNTPPKIPTVKLLVKNVSPSVDARALRNMFKRFGYVMEVELENGEGHVSLEATGDIGFAIKEMNGHVVQDSALTVEPAPADYVPPSQVKSNPSPAPSPNKKFKSPTKPNGRDPPWSNPNRNNRHPVTDRYPQLRPQEMYENDYDYTNDYYQYPQPVPQHYNRARIPPSRQIHVPPERILRDPYAHQNSHFSRGHPGAPGPSFRGPRPMGGRGGPPSRLNHPPPGPSRGMFHRAPLMRPGMPPRGPHPRGPPPYFNDNSQSEPMFYRRGDPELVMQNPFEEYSEEVFYEDEPLPTSIARSGVARMSLSGANSIPLGGAPHRSNSQPVSRTPGPLIPNLPRGGGGMSRGRGGMFGRGRGKPPQKFTALTTEVAPGEKYPVPPMHNPSFRAPLKWPKEDVKRKVKKKKKPLVPAELPDYSIPVPDLPKQTVPKGAILKPFPAPYDRQGAASTASQMDVDASFSMSGASGSSYSQSNNQNNHMDFTSDDF